MLYKSEVKGSRIAAEEASMHTYMSRSLIHEDGSLTGQKFLPAQEPYIILSRQGKRGGRENHTRNQRRYVNIKSW